MWEVYEQQTYSAPIDVFKPLNELSFPNEVEKTHF